MNILFRIYFIHSGVDKEITFYCFYFLFRQKYEEKDLHAKCMADLGLVALEKADNVTPSLMISCCSRLLHSTNRLAPILRGTHLWITTYYSVLSEGEICIPWNWKDTA